MLHQLVRPPSIHLSFNLACRTPQAVDQRVSSEATPQGHNLRVDIVYGVDCQYLILFAPHAFAPERQSSSRGRLRHRYSSRSLHFTATPEFLPLYETQACQYQMQFPG